MDSEPDLNEVTEKVKEYAELSKTIKVTQEKLKVLNKKKKELYKEVVPKLKNSNITKCNLPYGTLKVTKVKRKVAPTKTTIKDKYIIWQTYFKTKISIASFRMLSTKISQEQIFFEFFTYHLEQQTLFLISKT